MKVGTLQETCNSLDSRCGEKGGPQGVARPEEQEASLGSWDFTLGRTPLCILEGFLPPRPSQAQRGVPRDGTVREGLASLKGKSTDPHGRESCQKLRFCAWVGAGPGSLGLRGQGTPPWRCVLIHSHMH